MYILKNIFGKRAEQETKTETVVATAPSDSKPKYAPEIEQIHREFECAGEKILEQAHSVLKEAEGAPMEKVKRLTLLGFKQAKQVEETQQVIKKVELSQEIAELVRYYKREYPLHKFITEEQVKEICYKYNLICGEVSKYKGFVPEKNLKEIEEFKLREEDGTLMYKWGSSGWDTVENLMRRYDNPLSYFKGDRTIFRKMTLPLQICAPVKDMDMAGMTVTEGYKMQKIHVPDPVVLQPVKHGYLILSAWGDEASDPIVVNEINN